MKFNFSVTRLGSAWHIASTHIGIIFYHVSIIYIFSIIFYLSHIVAPYKSFSREKIPGTIGAYIGLMHLNVTLKGTLWHSLPRYNEIQKNNHKFFLFQLYLLGIGQFVILILMNNSAGMLLLICKIHIIWH